MVAEKKATPRQKTGWQSCIEDPILIEGASEGLLALCAARRKQITSTIKVTSLGGERFQFSDIDPTTERSAHTVVMMKHPEKPNAVLITGYEIFTDETLEGVVRRISELAAGA